MLICKRLFPKACYNLEKPFSTKMNKKKIEGRIFTLGSPSVQVNGAWAN